MGVNCFNPLIADFFQRNLDKILQYLRGMKLAYMEVLLSIYVGSSGLTVDLSMCRFWYMQRSQNHSPSKLRNNCIFNFLVFKSSYTLSPSFMLSQVYFYFQNSFFSVSLPLRPLFLTTVQKILLSPGNVSQKNSNTGFHFVPFVYLMASLEIHDLNLSIFQNLTEMQISFKLKLI